MMKTTELELSRIYTVNDFMTVLGEALMESDGDTIMRLQDISDGWMQSNEEHQAQQNLLSGALEAIGW